MDSQSANSNETNNRPNATSERKRICYRILTTTIRAGLSGLTLRGGLHLYTELSKSLSKNPKKHDNRNQLKETIQAVLFMGSMGFIFVTTEELIKYLLGAKK